ncbi:uncharacterized protein LOC108226103 [Daucus carota subsp. sativus]|uniref:uncharacterized protein LOC108226103 n=1 Tax=Daucus carota subsp. sativus TaxID=79200 RepID=UPI0007EF5363|nr:PREDICTED: uncharacterized protein LOC108226103 [Daucus carota subsp. sativus]XP_017256624.1 PREDICTED: uncharacterized protein LOC108226192 [Daucus carota subsp. sativus]
MLTWTVMNQLEPSGIIAAVSTNPSFVKSQLRRATESFETNQTLIVKRFDENEENDSPISLLSIDFRQIVADLKFPYSRGEFESAPDFILVGSANGIVCVAVAASETHPEHYWLFSPLARRRTNTYLWNPATRQSKVIPPYSFSFDITREALGFGYDPIDGDFKVVRVVANPFSAEVYSANRNAWRKVPNPIDFPWNDDFHVCLNGLLCCTGMYGMMAFDLNNEVLNCAIKLPVFSYEARIIECNKAIAVAIAMENGLDAKINMWTLDDDACLRAGGVVASWTLMLSVDLDLIEHPVYGYFGNGELLLIIDDDAWILYNANKKEAIIVPVSVDVCQIYKYTESLVSIAGFKQVNW